MDIVLADGNLTDSLGLVVDSYQSTPNNFTVNLLINSSANIDAGIRLTASSTNESLCIAGFEQANSTNLSEDTYFELEPIEDRTISLEIYIHPAANGTATVIVSADYFDNGEYLDPAEFEDVDWFEIELEIRINLEIEPA